MNGRNNFGWEWILLALAILVHVVDEAITGFLAVYNPTAMAIHDRLPWLPIPVFQFEVWFGGLLAAVALMLAVSPFAFCNARWLRVAAYVLAPLMVLNAISHTAGTITGRTLSGFEFTRPMPGFASSPLLAIAGFYLWRKLRRTAGEKREPQARAAHA